jgi:hypothetical protein
MPLKRVLWRLACRDTMRTVCGWHGAPTVSERLTAAPSKTSPCCADLPPRPHSLPLSLSPSLPPLSLPPSRPLSLSPSLPLCLSLIVSPSLSPRLSVSPSLSLVSSSLPLSLTASLSLSLSPLHTLTYGCTGDTPRRIPEIVHVPLCQLIGFCRGRRAETKIDHLSRPRPILRFGLRIISRRPAPVLYVIGHTMAGKKCLP